MILKFYDKNHNFLQLIDTLKDIYTEETLSTGFKTLCFKVPCLEEYFNAIQEENYVEDENSEYIIKEIINKDNNFITVYCRENIETIMGTVYEVFDLYRLSTPQAIRYCLRDTGWSLDFQSTDYSVITYQTAYVSAYDMLKTLTEEYGLEKWFDSKNKIVHIYDHRGKDLGAYYSNELRLKQLSKQSNTYDFATRVIPIGKDGLTIRSINGNKTFLENFSYSDKIITTVWINEDIDVSEKLKAAAEDYLNEICQPRASYKLKLTDLGTTVGIGDNILLVDKIKNIKQKQRVVKIIRYPLAPEKSILEISNLQIDLVQSILKNQADTQKQLSYLKNLYKNS